jgi:C4-dicarboxylate-specific signal transduction histidine kinase
MTQLSAAQLKEAGRQIQEITGKVSASVTHEIKNHLAVIKETSGLLHDLSMMAKSGNPLDPQRVAGLADRITQRIGLADGVVRRFNIFAHAYDQEEGELDLGEALNLMVDLHQRLANVKEVTLLAEKNVGSINIFTRPIFLMSALFYCLEAAVNAAQARGQVTARVEKGEDQARVEFKWPNGGRAQGGPGESLLAGLGATLISGGQIGELTLLIPINRESGGT